MFEPRKVSYYYVTATDRSADSPGILAELAGSGVNLLAFSMTPMGPDHTQYALFPENPEAFESIARKAGLQLSGPHRALILTGEDKVGAIDTIFRRLEGAGIHVFSSNAIAGSKGVFGLVLYVKPDEVDPAFDVLAS
jgi:hypothetical protein